MIQGGIPPLEKLQVIRGTVTLACLNFVVLPSLFRFVCIFDIFEVVLLLLILTCVGAKLSKPRCLLLLIQ